MSPRDFFVIAVTLLVCFGAVWAGLKLNLAGRGQPRMDELDFANETDRTISGIFVGVNGAQPQELLRGMALAPGAGATLKIDRWPLPDAADVRIVYEGGVEKLWPGLPMRGIFALRDDRRGEPRFEDQTVCS